MNPGQDHWQTAVLAIIAISPTSRGDDRAFVMILKIGVDAGQHEPHGNAVAEKLFLRADARQLPKSS